MVIGAAGERIEVPDVLPLLPVRDAVVFPGVTRPLAIGRAKSLAALARAGQGGLLVIASQREAETEDPELADLYPTACIVRVARIVDARGEGKQAIVVGVARTTLAQAVANEPCLLVRVTPLSEVDEPSPDRDAAWKQVIAKAQRIIDLREDLPDEWKTFVAGLPSPGLLTDLVASTLPLAPEEQIALLAEPNVARRLARVTAHLDREVTIAETQRRLTEQSGGGEQDPKRREKLLRRRMRDIQTEIGESDGGSQEVDDLRERIEAAQLPPDAAAQAERELKRLAALPQHAPDRHLIRTYLEWLADLPWAIETEDKLDLREARRILDADHYDLEKVKDRILEYLAVRKLAPEAKGPILCFVGPPGVGKTSLGRSISHAMGRNFVRASLGGVRDEAEIRGHRRTYVGAMPGRVVQSLRRAGSRNPVFLLDEIDKLGADFRGDPSSALLEVLDPEQNSTFSDHYLEVAFDLSRIFFIATANTLSTIPPALLDRMEVIELPGYTDREKLKIARDHLVPKQRDAHGLREDQIAVQDGAIERVVHEYTREAGVRNLDRHIAKLMRKAARRVAEEKPTETLPIDAAFVGEALGAPPHLPETAERTVQPGVVVGLARTAHGGDILFIEATAMPGGKDVRLRLTGQLGEVMKESAGAALSWVRANAEALGLRAKVLTGGELHLHVPAGAVPKDGPSAGIALVTAIVSVLSGRRARGDVAMTGEISLRGRVLPVGGIKDKVLAAARAGIKTVILPRRNEKDLVDVPDEVKAEIEIRLADAIEEVLDAALEPAAR
ncbi:MAG: endopeptidase La [Proteobacteria bacterium]|nr:MAG: endopeptidase La [Pseudomonadota bacterium]